MAEEQWHDLGDAEDFRQRPLTTVRAGRAALAVSYRDGAFGIISNLCNHAGGPLGEGVLEGDYVVCPWHYWQFHRITGQAQPGYADAVPHYDCKVENGRLLVNLVPAGKRVRAQHKPHSLIRAVERAEGPIRVAGISTTSMTPGFPRYSTSDDLLRVALDHAVESLGAETRLLRLQDLSIRPCEGYYSKSAKACTWPCSITQMDPRDQMDQVYEALVFWADVIVVSTPIRWGNAGSLYYKMIERLNCVQNQMTLRDKALIQNKVAAFIITGGQDNIQSVAGQMMMFFGELGFSFPPFPFIAHSRGWSAEDMESNMAFVRKDEQLRHGAQELVARSVATATTLLAAAPAAQRKPERGGRKACRTVEIATASPEGD